MSQSTAAPETASRSAAAMKILPWQAILIALAWPMIGFFISMVIEMVFNVDVSKLVRSIISLAVNVFGAFYLFPKIYRAPFGAVPLKEYLDRLGFILPPRAWRHVLLGVVLAACTLSGMLVASLLTGRYVLDWSTINLPHIVFSLNPGIFEEFFYRGMIVILLLPLVKSLKKALIFQILIFGLAHIKDLSVLGMVEVVSVMIIAIAFTFAACKTRALLAGIVFHFLHDALLFFVQVPGGEFTGLRENLLFYAFLWPMVGVACLVIWFAAERLNVRADRELYVQPSSQ